ncbi:MAG: hypothetical protein R2882_04835 [Gemmatimonadales bacterium]
MPGGDRVHQREAIPGGRSAPFTVRTGAPGSIAPAAAPATAAPLPAGAPPDAATEFHDRLRQLEHDLAANRPPATAPPRATAGTASPAPGNVRSFKVCASLKCTAFTTVTAVARAVSRHAAIYLDQNAPPDDSLRQADLETLARHFDTYHHPIDVAAFGPESDIDGNGVVDILLTKAVNDLTPDCTNGRVLGYFFGLDLLAGQPNSNDGEIFYAFVPSPGTARCSAISRETAVAALEPTLIHEFQHMISFNQHVLIRGGGTELTWLNEGMSHFAEELGGRLIPAAECPGFSSCRSQYVSGDLFNAYDYLTNPEAHYLIYPTESTGTLEERGASWLFVRWLADQFGSDSTAPNLTLAIDNTAAQGAGNVTAFTQSDFARLVTEWHLALYLDDLDGFTPDSPRLTYSTWGFRSVYTDPRNAQAFPNGFPLSPAAVGGPFQHQGTLRGGSAYYLLATPGPGAEFDIKVGGTSNDDPVDAGLGVAIGLARIR